MSLCVCHLRARRTGADIGDVVKKSRFDVSMTCEIMSNTTTQFLWKIGSHRRRVLEKYDSPVLFRKKEVTAVMFRYFCWYKRATVGQNLVYKALTPGGNMPSA
jgi:hypothetical protein